jgi:aspartyl-tRNA(Asn)/glutamyl-tRNA(Gln) amidotransferase subunit B
MLERGESPAKIVREKGLGQVSDYRSGMDKVFGFLVGQVMKATQGKANPQMVNEILRDKLRFSSDFPPLSP